jgi:hypothetical protein
MRQQQSAPLLADLRERLLIWKEQLLPRHPMAEAINYALGQWAFVVNKHDLVSLLRSFCLLSLFKSGKSLVEVPTFKIFISTPSWRYQECENPMPVCGLADKKLTGSADPLLNQTLTWD